MRSLFLPVVVIAALLALAAPARAQAPNIVEYHQQIFAPGVNTNTGTPLQTNIYQASALLCGQVAPVVPATVVNPTRFFFDDVAQPGKVCLGTLSSTLLPALPNGVGYLTTATQVDNLGQESPRSAASNPFGKQGIPTVLTGYKIAGS